MAQVEELLEQAKKDGVSEDLGYNTPQDAYSEQEWDQQKVKNWPRQIHLFGLRQNQINRSTAARIRALEIQNRTLEIQIQRLEEILEMVVTRKELGKQLEPFATKKDLEEMTTKQEMESLSERERKVIGRMAAEMDQMQIQLKQMGNKLRNNLEDARLRSKLEDNAYDRVQKRMDHVEAQMHLLRTLLEHLAKGSESQDLDVLMPTQESQSDVSDTNCSDC